jgi:hypothetical protein
MSVVQHGVQAPRNRRLVEWPLAAAVVIGFFAVGLIGTYRLGALAAPCGSSSSPRMSPFVSRSG